MESTVGMEVATDTNGAPPAAMATETTTR
jgi:hypothetical protein